MVVVVVVVLLLLLTSQSTENDESSHGFPEIRHEIKRWVVCVFIEIRRGSVCVSAFTTGKLVVVSLVNVY